MTALRSRLIAPIVAVVSSGIVVIVATLFPWASQENRATEVTTDFEAGAVGLVLVALVLVAVACALRGWSERSAMLQNIATVLSAGCLAIAVVLALTRISAANDAAMAAAGGSRTSYEPGAVLGVLGSAALLTSCFVLHRSRSEAGQAIDAAP